MDNFIEHKNKKAVSTLSRLLESDEPVKPGTPEYELVKKLLTGETKIELPDFTNTKKPADNKIELPDFTKYLENKNKSQNEAIEYLTEEENAEVDKWVRICEEEHNGDLMDEGFLGKLFGGAAGFILGPTVGKVIARALGVEKGVLYDMLTSRIVSAALGVAIAKKFGGEYKDKE